MIEINDREFKLFQEYLQNICGIIIPREKQYLFNTRLDKILVEQQCRSFAELYRCLEKNGKQKLADQIVEVMTTNETSFFRDIHPFETLATVILPELAGKKKKEAGLIPPRLRIWSAGCSTGQEAYSIAMVVKEWLGRNPEFIQEMVTIIASDISPTVINRAKQGRYTTGEVAKGMLEVFKGKYINKTGEDWCICQDLKKMINFRIINLAREFPPELVNLDLIFCRNTVIYFSDQLKKKIIEQFYRVLNPGGILVIGAAENLYGITDRFEAAPAGPTTIYRMKTND